MRPGHIPGFWWFPGGQAVQRADDTVAVRNGTVVFCCDGTVRAAVTASWYRQMGFPNVFAVAGGTTAWRAAGKPLAKEADDPVEPFVREARARVSQVSAAELASAVAGARPPIVIYVDPSDRFAAGHVPGARWLSRGWLELRTAKWRAATPQGPSSSPTTMATTRCSARHRLLDLGYRTVAALAGGTEAWRKEGRPLEQGLTGVVRPPDDVVPAGPDRSFADMINYLRWEERLGHKYASSAESA